jgi:subtilisin family serine protease
MSEPIRARKSVSRLSMEVLEDRTNPTAILSENLSAFAGDRVLVTLDSPASAGVLTASPLAEAVQRLGGNAYVVSLNAGVTVGQAVTTFSGSNGVLFAEPDFQIGGHVVPNDPAFANLWGLNNANDADIDAPEAWDTARGTGATIVAVIDTGVQYTHPDLAANMWRNTGETPGDGIDNDGNGFVDDVYGYDFANNDGNPMDDNGHGTHVAGTIGAVGNNGVGVTGVAWTTRIMALKFLGANGSGSTSGAVGAIYYAVDNGATVLNNSWGGGGYSQSLFNAISYANARGVIFVAAAGNNGRNNDTTANYPSNYALPNVVSVASTTSTNGLSSFSNFGANTVTLGAPGSSIYSTYLNGGYATLSGTSMATPHVAGALAVYWDANPNATAAAVIQKLKSSVDPLTSLAGKTVTGGRLNLNTLLAGTSPPPPPPPPTDTRGARVVSGAFSGSAADTYNAVRLTFDEAINASTFTVADVAAFTGPNGVTITPTGVAPVSGSNGTQFDITFATQSAVGTYTITVGPDIRDLAGNLMNQDGDGINGEATQDRSTTSAEIAPPYQTFGYTSNTQVAIRDRATVIASLVVPTVAGRTNVPISDVNVTVNLAHTWTSDLRLYLVAPNGANILLFNRRGGSGDNLTNTTFNDEAGTAIAAGAAPFTGSFKPEQLLSRFDGLNAAGTWRLYIQDLARGDIGRLRSFTLTFTTGTAPGGQSVRMFAFNDAGLDAPTELKADSAAPAVVERFARPVSPTVSVTAPAPTTAVGSPFAPAAAPALPSADVMSASPVVTPTAAAVSVSVTPTAVAATPVTPAPQAAHTVDFQSLFTLFQKTDAFAPIRL